MVDNGRNKKPQWAPRAQCLTLTAAAAVAGGLLVPPATAGEYATFQNIEIASATAGCRSSALLNRPSNWRAGEGAVVLLVSAPMSDTVRDAFVAQLLFERIAVLERVQAPCDTMVGPQGGMAGGMRSALPVLGGDAGPVVALGYGPGSRAVLEVLREPAAAQQDGSEARYSAAVSIGDGEPIFLLEPRGRTGGQDGGLAPLCRALSAVAAGMGATPQQDTALQVAGACMTGMTSHASLATVTAR